MAEDKLADLFNTTGTEEDLETFGSNTPNKSVTSVESASPQTAPSTSSAFALKFGAKKAQLGQVDGADDGDADSDDSEDENLVIAEAETDAESVAAASPAKISTRSARKKGKIALDLSYLGFLKIN